MFACERWQMNVSIFTLESLILLPATTRFVSRNQQKGLHRLRKRIIFQVPSITHNEEDGWELGTIVICQLIFEKGRGKSRNFLIIRAQTLSRAVQNVHDLPLSLLMITFYKCSENLWLGIRFRFLNCMHAIGIKSHRELE